MMWSVAPGETDTPEQLASDLLDQAHPGGIALFHGWTDNTPPGLQIALPALRKQGYQFVTVSELIGLSGRARIWGGTPVYVQQGDTFERLGACYHTHPTFLAAFNEMARAPRAGDRLIIPHRDEVIIRLGDHRIPFDVYPRTVQGRTMVPVRAVADPWY